MQSTNLQRPLFGPALLLAAVLIIGQQARGTEPAETAEAAGEQGSASSVESSASSEETSPLAALAWTVGDWTDSAGDSRVAVSCRWSKNDRFLVRQFSIEDQGETLLEGTQVIGWDPVDEVVRSWTFDSEGGFGQGLWSRDGDRWLIEASFTLATGEQASATHVLTRTGDNTATWASINREVGGRLLPNQPELEVVRVEPTSKLPAETPTEAAPEGAPGADR